MRDYVTTSWGQLHLRFEGKDGPGLVLLHESPLSSEVYEAVIPSLGRDFRVVAVDTPGYGLSDGPQGPAEISDYSQIILEGIDGFGLKSFAVAGAHTGASLAIQLSVQSPDRVTHAILSGVPVFDSDERASYLASWAPEVQVAPDGSHFGWAWNRYERIWSGPPDLVHIGAVTLLKNLDRYHIGYRAAFRYDPEPDLSLVRCPVLLYTAAQDLLIESDRRALPQFPNARLEVVDDCVGQLPLRMPEAYADRIRKFVLSE